MHHAFTMKFVFFPHTDVCVFIFENHYTKPVSFFVTPMAFIYAILIDNFFRCVLSCIFVQRIKQLLY